MLIVHENGETRVGDSDFIASKYGAKNTENEKKAFKDQISKLPTNIRKLFYSLFKEKERFETLESRVAWDADILEQIISAKELADNGVEGAKLWLDDKYVWHAASGKKLFDEVRKGKSWEWLPSINN